MITLTQQGKETVEAYITELKAKRKEIIDARKDTASETYLPDIEDIINDIDEFINENGEYYNNWGVTDHYDADYPLYLQLGKDFNF